MFDGDLITTHKGQKGLGKGRIDEGMNGREKRKEGERAPEIGRAHV